MLTGVEPDQPLEASQWELGSGSTLSSWLNQRFDSMIGSTRMAKMGVKGPTIAEARSIDSLGIGEPRLLQIMIARQQRTEQPESAIAHSFRSTVTIILA